jgi:hypothetical protein
MKVLARLTNNYYFKWNLNQDQDLTLQPLIQSQAHRIATWSFQAFQATERARARHSGPRVAVKKIRFNEKYLW